jgi:hypothetical protein
MSNSKLFAYNCTDRTIEFHVVGGECLRLPPRQDTEITSRHRASPALKRLERERLVIVSTSRERKQAESVARDERTRLARAARDDAQKRLDKAHKAAAQQKAAARKQAAERKAAEK